MDLGCDWGKGCLNEGRVGNASEVDTYDGTDRRERERKRAREKKKKKKKKTTEKWHSGSYGATVWE